MFLCVSQQVTMERVCLPFLMDYTSKRKMGQNVLAKQSVSCLVCLDVIKRCYSLQISRSNLELAKTVNTSFPSPRERVWVRGYILLASKHHFHDQEEYKTALNKAFVMFCFYGTHKSGIFFNTVPYTSMVQLAL